MGVMIIFALSYNMLLGQTGLLSFGHAVYYGLGGFVAIHAMNAVIHGKLGVPVAVMPDRRRGWPGSASAPCSASFRPGARGSSFR